MEGIGSSLATIMCVLEVTEIGGKNKRLKTIHIGTARRGLRSNKYTTTEALRGKKRWSIYLKRI